MGSIDIVKEIADRYGLQWEDLEAGAYPPDQMKVLVELSGKAIHSGADADWKNYFEQKAKFLTARKNPIA